MAEDTLRNNVRNDIRQTTTLPFSFKNFVSGIGMAISRAGTRTWDKLSDMPDELRSGFSKVSSTIQSSTTEIMGSALNSMLGDIKSLASGIKDITTGTFKKLFSFFGSDEDESLDEEKKQTKTLRNIFKIFKKWSIRDMFKPKEKKEDDGVFFTPLAILGLALGAITGGIAAGIGGVIEYFLIPFKVVLNSLKGVTTLLKESSIGKLFVNFFGKVRAFFGGWIDNALLSISSFFGKFKIFAGFFKGFGVGFMKIFSKIPVIGWFITGVMAVIDFFTGFFGTEGNFFEKIKAGVLKMIIGFFDPIFEFVGWITNWVLGLFGIDSNVGQTLKTGFSDLLNLIFNLLTYHITGIFRVIWDSIIKLKDWVLNYPIKDKFLEAWEWVKTASDTLIGIDWNLRQTLKTGISDLLNFIFDIFTVHIPSIFTGIWNSIIEIKDWVLNYPIKEKFLEVWEWIQTASDNLIASIKKWLLDLIPSFEDIKDWVLNYPIKEKFLEVWEWIQTASDNLIASIKKWLLDLIPSFEDIKDMLPSFDSIKNSIINKKDDAIKETKAVWEGTKSWFADTFGKDDASPSTTVNELDSSNKAREMANTKELAKAIHKTTEQLIKESKKRDEEKKSSVNQQVNVSSVQNSRGSSGGTFIEAPDEIENFGIVFMNKTTLGGTF